MPGLHLPGPIVCLISMAAKTSDNEVNQLFIQKRFTDVRSIRLKNGFSGKQRRTSKKGYFAPVTSSVWLPSIDIEVT